MLRSQGGHLQCPAGVEEDASCTVPDSVTASSVAEDRHSNATRLPGRSMCAECQADSVRAGRKSPEAARAVVQDSAQPRHLGRHLQSCQEQAAGGLGESLPCARHLCHAGLSGTAPPSGCLTQFVQLPHVPRVIPVRVSQREGLVLTATTQQNAVCWCVHGLEVSLCFDFLSCLWAVHLCGARVWERARGQREKNGLLRMYLNFLLLSKWKYPDTGLSHVRTRRSIETVPPLPCYG